MALVRALVTRFTSSSEAVDTLKGLCLCKRCVVMEVKVTRGVEGRSWLTFGVVLWPLHSGA